MSSTTSVVACLTQRLGTPKWNVSVYVYISCAPNYGTTCSTPRHTMSQRPMSSNICCQPPFSKEGSASGCSPYLSLTSDTGRQRLLKGKRSPILLQNGQLCRPPTSAWRCGPCSLMVPHVTRVAASAFLLFPLGGHGMSLPSVSRTDALTIKRSMKPSAKVSSCCSMLALKLLRSLVTPNWRSISRRRISTVRVTRSCWRQKSADSVLGLNRLMGSGSHPRKRWLVFQLWPMGRVSS